MGPTGLHQCCVLQGPVRVRARRGLVTHSPCSAKLEFVELFPSRSLVRLGAAGYLHLPQLHWPEPEIKGGAQCGQERLPSPSCPHCIVLRQCWGGVLDGLGFICVTFLLSQLSCQKSRFALPEEVVSPSCQPFSGTLQHCPVP